LIVHELPDDELARYRPAIEAVTIDSVRKAATTRINPSRMAIVLVGDADAFGPAFESAGFGPVTIERDEGPVEDGSEAGLAAAIGPVDIGPEGPTEGAEEPTDVETSEPVAADRGTDGDDAR
jgi:hypothetical protein